MCAALTQTLNPLHLFSFMCVHILHSPPLLLSSLPCGDAATVSIFQLDPSGARLEKSVEKALRSLCCASVHPLPFLFVPRLPYLLPCFLPDCFSSLFDVLFLRFASFGYGFQLCSLLKGRRA